MKLLDTFILLNFVLALADLPPPNPDGGQLKYSEASNQGLQTYSTHCTTKFTAFICISGPCQAPAGYNYEASVDKYYKEVKNKVKWDQARDACSSEGTMLIELRTIEDYQAIRPIYGKHWII